MYERPQNPIAYNIITLDRHCTYVHCIYNVQYYCGTVFMFYQDTCAVDTRTCLCDTPLHIVTREGTFVQVEQLVGYGADVTVVNSLGNTPLHYILAKKNQTPLSEMAPHLNQVLHVTLDTQDTFHFVLP